MKRYIFCLFLWMLVSFQTTAQIRLNPQVGVSLLDIDNDSYRDLNTLVEGNFSAEIGVMAGVDARIGNQLYFQPGVYYSKSVSLARIKETVFAPNDTVISVSYYADKLLRTSIKVKAMMGFNPINKRLFKLRLMAGPTYDFMVGASNKGTEINVDTRNFENGSFSFDAAIGLDFYRITYETGFTRGLTAAFDESRFYDFDSKYVGYYMTVGVLIGKAKAKKKKDNDD